MPTILKNGQSVGKTCNMGYPVETYINSSAVSQQELYEYWNRRIILALGIPEEFIYRGPCETPEPELIACGRSQLCFEPGEAWGHMSYCMCEHQSERKIGGKLKGYCTKYRKFTYVPKTGLEND